MPGFQYLQRPDYIGNALSGLIDAQQGHEQQESAQRQQRIKFLLDQYLKQPAEVQTRLYATAPPDIKAYLVDPSLAYNTPDAQMQRQIQGTVGQNTLNVARNFHPTGGDTSAINYDLITKKSAPKEVLEQGYMRDYLTPSQIGTTMTAPAVKDLATASNQSAEAGLRNAQTPWVAPQAKARIGLQGAQAAQAGAAAGKTRYEMQEAKNKSAASAAYLLHAAGPGGHIIGSNDGTTWYDTATGEQVKQP